jgi:hypothetical protein
MFRPQTYVPVNGLTEYAELLTAYRDALVARRFPRRNVRSARPGRVRQAALFIRQDDQVAALHLLIQELGNGGCERERPFVMALRRVEFESGRLLQAQIMFLKGESLVQFRDAVTTALERRHAEVHKLWREMLESIDITRNENDAKP